MPNDLGSAPGTLIARRALDTLLESFPFLRMITADFTDEQALFNQPASVKIPNAFSGASNYSVETGYAASDVSQDDVALVIDKHKHVTYCFSDTERSSHDVGLVERFARNAAHALGLAMMGDLLALVTNSNFSNKSEPTTAASLDRAALVAISNKLDVRKLPSMGRYCLLNSDAYAALCSDETLISNPGSPSQTVRSGELGNVHGFNTIAYAHLPNNSENLIGFAGVPESLVIATRVPTLPDKKALGGGSVEIVTEPDTKLSLQLRSWYDYKAGLDYTTFTLMYGVAVGNPACLERIVTTS